jgi:hypothetical protein
VDPTGHAPITAITKALAAFKAAKKIAPTTLKSISKPSKASGNRIESNTVSSKRRYAATRKGLNERRQRADLKELAETIIKNEAELPDSAKKYSTPTHPPTTYEDSLRAYEYAKDGYGFEKFPDPDQVHWVHWTEDAPTIVDTFHFDATLFHQIHTNQRKYLLNNKNGGSYTTIDRLIILRAIYLDKYAGTKLMAIRQEKS